MFGRRSTRRRVKRRQPHVPLSAGFLFDDDAPTAPLPVIPMVSNESYYVPSQTSELPPSYPTDPNSPAPYAGPDWITDVVPCPAAEKLAKAWPARAQPTHEPAYRAGQSLPGRVPPREPGSSGFPRAKWPSEDYCGDD